MVSVLHNYGVRKEAVLWEKCERNTKTGESAIQSSEKKRTQTLESESGHPNQFVDGGTFDPVNGRTY